MALKLFVSIRAIFLPSFRIRLQTIFFGRSPPSRLVTRSLKNKAKMEHESRSRCFTLHQKSS